MLIKISSFLILMLTGSLSAQNCKSIPSFISELGFDPSISSLSTSDKRTMGIVLQQIGNNKSANSKSKIYKHPSWEMAGYLGSITRDRWGNSYVSPAAHVNLLSNKPLDQNNIYQINSETGIMDVFVTLPIVHPMTNENPFGVIGASYDCSTDYLFYSSIYGSTQKNEYGSVYAIDVKSKKYHPVLHNVDAFGVCALQFSGKNYLVYGLTRKSEIWCLELDGKNYPKSKPFKIIDLKGVGKRGDDKARKIVFEEGVLKIYGKSFYYNLTSPVITKESIYKYKLGSNISSWIPIN